MAEEKIYLTIDEILNKTLGPQIFQIMADEKIYITTDKTLSKSTSGKTIKIMVEEKITTQTNKPSNKNLRYLITNTNGKIIKNSYELKSLLNNTDWKKLQK